MSQDDAGTATGFSGMTRRLAAETIAFHQRRVEKFLKLRSQGSGSATMIRMAREAHAAHLGAFAPCYRFRLCSVALPEHEAGGVLLDGQRMLQGKGVRSLLKDARMAAVFVATLGAEVDRVGKGLSAKDMVEGYIFDGVASAMVQGALDHLQHELETEAAKMNLRLTHRYSPGYPAWPLQDQAPLFDLLQPGDLGVELTQGYYMLPHKSVSGVFGLRP